MHGTNTNNVEDGQSESLGHPSTMRYEVQWQVDSESSDSLLVGTIDQS